MNRRNPLARLTLAGLFSLAAGAAALSLTACDDEPDDMEDVAEDMGDSLEDAADETDDAIDDMNDEIDDGIDDLDDDVNNP